MHHSHEHKGIDTSGNRERLIPERVCAIIRAMSPRGKGRATRSAAVATAPPIPAATATATSVHEMRISLPRDGLERVAIGTQAHDTIQCIAAEPVRHSASWQDKPDGCMRTMHANRAL